MQHAGIMQNLIRHGADVNAKNNTGMTPLMMAAEKGYIELLEVLLTAKADINSKNKAGKSALDLAEKNKHTHVVERLIKEGAR